MRIGKSGRGRVLRSGRRANAASVTIAAVARYGRTLQGKPMIGAKIELIATYAKLAAIEAASMLKPRSLRMIAIGRPGRVMRIAATAIAGAADIQL